VLCRLDCCLVPMLLLYDCVVCLRTQWSSCTMQVKLSALLNAAYAAFACLSAVTMASRAFLAAIALILGCLAVANAQGGCIECNVSCEACRDLCSRLTRYLQKGSHLA
jgi:hypothetical protein